MFGVTVVTSPTVEPVSLDEARHQCRIAAGIGHFDAELTALIVAARRYCETATQRAFCTQTLRLTRDAFPGAKECYQFRLPRPPLQTVTNIQYTDANGVTQTVSSSSYVVDASPEVGRIALAYGYDWPTDAIQQIAAVKVNYVAGYGAAAAVPATVKQAMLLLIAHWFANKEAAITGTIQTATEFAVSILLNSEWSGSLAGAYG